MDLHILRCFISKNHIFNCWSVSVYQHNAKINYSSNSKLAILHVDQMYMVLEIFYEDKTNSLMQEYTKGFKNITAYGQIFLLMHFNVFRQH